MKKILLVIIVLLSIILLPACQNNDDKELEIIYDDIVKELFDKNIVPSNWKYVDTGHGWGFEKSNNKDKYYFYINNNDYDNYKNYWLEDTDKSKMYSDMNKDLSTNGKRVFYAININVLSYSKDTDYVNLQLKKDINYYLVRTYDNSLYYKYVGRYTDENNYSISSSFDCDSKDIINEYILHQEDNKWVIEEIHR